MAGFCSQTWVDYNDETSNVRVAVTPLTAVNFDAQGTLRDAFRLAMLGITRGKLRNYAFGNDFLMSAGPGDYEDAQRELKWLVSYHDNTSFKKYSFEVPCPATEYLDPNDRAHAHIGDAADIDGFITATEAYVLSPEGHAITVDEITLVGRNV